MFHIILLYITINEGFQDVIRSIFQHIIHPFVIHKRKNITSTFQIIYRTEVNRQ